MWRVKVLRWRTTFRSTTTCSLDKANLKDNSTRWMKRMFRSPATYKRVPIVLREPPKQELDRLSNIGVIRKVDTPTKWISAAVVTTKKNGKVRLCINPKPLKWAIRRNHYPLPTIDGVLPLLSKAHMFTVLDAKNGLWQILLDRPSSCAIAYETPWGWYQWLRMPFKVSLAAEEFQRHADNALEGYQGRRL